MSLEATLEATVDGDVTFDFRVRNTGDSGIELTFSDGQTADVVVYEDGSDKEVWRWSEGMFFTQMIETSTLASGESISQQFVWENPDSGEYTATGTLEADKDATASTEFSV